MAFTLNRKVLTTFEAESRDHVNEVTKIENAKGRLDAEREKNHQREQRRHESSKNSLGDYRRLVGDISSHFEALSKVGRFAWESIEKAGKDATGSTKENFDLMTKAGANFTTALDNMKTALGKLLLALAPVVEKISQAAVLVSEITKTDATDGAGYGEGLGFGDSWVRIGFAADLMSGPNGIMRARQALNYSGGKLDLDTQAGAHARRMARVQQLYAEGRDAQAHMLALGRRPEDVSPGTDYAQAFLGSILSGTPADTWDAGSQSAMSGGARGGRAIALTIAEALARIARTSAVGATGGGFGSAGGTSLLGAAAGFGNPLGADITAALGSAEMTSRWNGELAQRRRNESRLSAMFGPLEEFNAYKMAFDSLSGAVGTALGAWIDGSQSAAKAFKAFIGEAVKGIAIQMAMEAIKHGAFALGSLAFGDVRGAATHGKAAAAFAAGAVVASVAAKGLHGGGGAPSTGAGAAAPVGGAGGYAGSQPRYEGTHKTIFIGDAYGGSDSPRQRAHETRRRYEEAYGATGVLNS